MNVGRFLPALAMALGSVVIAGTVACGGGDSKPKATETQAAASTDASATTTATATAASPTATPVPPTPTATPTPFDGKVARFKFPKFGVDAPVDALGVNTRDELDTPHSGRENLAVAWYDNAAESNKKGFFLGTRPGWGGNAVFSAHVYYINRSACPNNPLACPAPFQKLSQAAVGDELSIVMENGAEYHYKVISKTRYNRDRVPMGDIISPPNRPQDKEWITMMTCGGALDASGLEYVDRDVVVAERVS